MANQRTSCNGVRCVCVCSSGSNDRHRKWADAIWTVAFHIAAFYSGGMFEGWDFFLDSHAFFSPNHQIGEGFVYACVWYIRGFSDLMWLFSFLFFPFGNPITWASVMSGCALWSLSYHDALFVFWGDPFVNYSNIIFVCGHDSSQRFWVCS